MTDQSKLPGAHSVTDDGADTVPEGKVKCYITGKIREDTPEERTRQTIARSLVEEYGYNKSDIELEYSIKMGRSKKRADIVIFKEDEQHVQGNAYIIAEVKSEDIKPSNKENGIDQLESYISACFNVEFGLWVGSERLAYRMDRSGSGSILEVIPDIPRKGESSVPKPTRGTLTPAVNLKEVFRRIHNYIYANQGIQKDKAFEELLKLIFIKVHDENFSPTIQFYVGPDEDPSRLRDRLEDLFSKVKHEYEYIFDHKDRIELNNQVLKYVVSELQRFSLVGTTTDVKGEAYEELVGPNLRGDRGEFFTPRNVCNMTIDMSFSLLKESNLTSPGGVSILDPAVGTGGFLISAIRNVESVFNERGSKPDEVRDRIQNISNSNLYGIDFNPFLVKVAQMNNVMHGDGSANIVHANSLQKPSEWSDDAARKVSLGEFDLVITNPPFGSKAVIDDPDILNQYALATYGTDSPRESIPPEQLFIERCLDFLHPSGIMGIVLPDSILSNPGLEWLRDWLLSEANILASVDLPVEAFQPHTGTQTSVLILQKKAPGQSGEDYDIFMAMPEKVGHDRRGNPEYRRAPDGEIIVDDDGQEIISDDLPMVSEAFEKWVREKGIAP